MDIGRLRQLPPFDERPPVNIYLLSNTARRLSDAEAAFLAACEGAIADADLAARTYR